MSYQIKRGEKRYELSNHLGNVLAVISDKLNRVCNNDTVSYFTAEVMFAYDYSPFGAILPQRSYAADSSCTTVIDYDTAYNDHYEVTFTLTTLLSPGQNIRLDNGNGTTKILATYNAGYVNVLSYKGQIITNVSPAADGIIYITQSGATLKLRFSADSLGFICGDNVSVISGTTTLTSVSIDCAIDSIFAVDTITVCSSGDYRFGFNGMEKDNSIKGTGNSYDFGARIYDSRLGRWMSLDPLQQKYPYATPYNFGANNPIIFVDIGGKDIYIFGEDAEKTVAELQKVSSLTLSYNPLTKKLTAIGVPFGPLQEHDQFFLEALTNEKIEVNLTTTKGNYISKASAINGKEYQLIGANFGSKIVEETEEVWNPNGFNEEMDYEQGSGAMGTKTKTRVVTSQAFNYDHSEAVEKKGLSSKGIDALHEILESYIGGINAPGETDGQKAWDVSHHIAMAVDSRATVLDIVYYQEFSNGRPTGNSILGVKAPNDPIRSHEAHLYTTNRDAIEITPQTHTPTTQTSSK